MNTTLPRHPAAHAAVLAHELDWLEACVQARLGDHFQAAPPADDAAREPLRLPDPPALPTSPEGAGPYVELVSQHGLGANERLVLALALAPHLRPAALDMFFIQNKTLGREFTEFGGLRGESHRGFLPTCETALFLLAGQDLVHRLNLMPYFEPEHPLSRDGVLRIDAAHPAEPRGSAALRPSSETLAWLVRGVRDKPDFGAGFPARLITTRLDWDDLVLGEPVRDEIDSLIAWARHAETLMDDWGLRKSVKPGYRALFYGPPGTGKTLTATLIGQAVKADVYRIDLSMVVSKYIGETEKNLAQVFDQAQHRRWILFFDEADALFGKRTAASSSNDRHANQEVSYLLQRIEDHPGIVILASNLRHNIDEAFVRRFQSMVHFPMPDGDERLRLWQMLARQTGRLAPDIDLAQLAEQHELAGGAITNVLRDAAIQSLRQQHQQIGAADLRRAITRERRKEGRAG